jgi:hypothetical protein
MGIWSIDKVPSKCDIMKEKLDELREASVYVKDKS